MHTQSGAKTIVLTGGGSGGHITPLLAVASSLKQQDSSARIISIGERGSAFSSLTETHQDIDTTYAISAGKFRRYADQNLLQKLLDVRTNLLNIRDLFRFIAGTVQAFMLLKRVRPDVVFLKGGFVGVPVGLAAAMLKIPMVTHDSDAIPGLANRIVSRFVAIHATGMPADMYPYPSAKTVHVGVLVGTDYSPVADDQQQQFKAELNVPSNGNVLFITGGSLGSRRINEAIAGILPQLLESNADLHVFHQVGKNNLSTYGDYSSDRLHVSEFVSGMHKYSGAADVIVSRAGANTIAEFGVQHKACIIIPSPFLAGGHQLKNADVLQKSQAAVILQESALRDSPQALSEAITELLADSAKRRQLGDNLASIGKVGASDHLAQIILEQAA